MNREIWEDIKDYPNYQVSNFGNVRSKNWEIETNIRNNKKVIRKGKILKPIKYKTNYCAIDLSKNKKIKRVLIHILVASTFLNKKNFKSMPDENRDLIDLNTLEVNHKDENPFNNNVNNLEWCTSKYNCNYGNRNKKIAVSLGKTVYQKDKQGKIIKVYNSISEASRNVDRSITCIYDCCIGKQKTCAGFYWNF
jgi:hypothetical protein